MLSLSLAFILSQDQTLRCCLSCSSFFKKTKQDKFINLSLKTSLGIRLRLSPCPDGLFIVLAKLTEPKHPPFTRRPLLLLYYFRICLSNFQYSLFRLRKCLGAFQLGKVTANNRDVQILFKSLTSFKLPPGLCRAAPGSFPKASAKLLPFPESTKFFRQKICPITSF